MISLLRNFADRRRSFLELREKIRNAGTDSLAHFQNSYAFEGGLSLQQNPDEFARLCLFLKGRSPLGTYVEIGSASGGACRFIYENVGFERALILDDGRHPRAGEQDGNFSAIPHLQRFVGDSHSAAAKSFLEANLHGPISAAFIDGDHSYEGVWQDIQLIMEFVTPGTVLILHDTVACEGVKKAWRQMKELGSVAPRAEYIGRKRALGIGVAEAVAGRAEKLAA